MSQKEPKRDDVVKRPNKKPGPPSQRSKQLHKIRQFKKTTTKSLEEVIESTRLERDNLKTLHVERERVKREIERQKELISAGLSQKDKHNMVIGLLKELDVDTVEELVNLARGDDISAREKVGIWKFLTPYQNPMPKSVDTQKGESMQVSVAVTEFSNTRADDPNLANTDEQNQLKDEDYERFQLKDDKKH